MIDQDLMEQLQYTMIEPPDGGASWPSDLWCRDEVLDYINERSDRFVKATHIRVATTSIPVIAGTFEYTLPTNWVATARVYWQPTTGQKKALVRSSGWEADHGIGSWSTQGVPKLYTDVDPATLTLRLMPVPSVPGTLEVIYVANTTHVIGEGDTLSIIDEFLPSIKYAALADMFSKVGRAHDPIRAEYCEQRFTLGTEIANILLKGFSR
jgi:hypothetical protein